jgi:hypothetical protein
MKRARIRDEFGTRKGTKLDKLVCYLVPKADKEIKLKRLAKMIHRKDKVIDPVNATRMSINGLNRHIQERNLPYKPVTYSRAGKEITLRLQRTT